LEAPGDGRRAAQYILGPDPVDRRFISLMESGGVAVRWVQVPAALDERLTRLLEEIHAKQAPERHEL